MLYIFIGMVMILKLESLILSLVMMREHVASQSNCLFLLIMVPLILLYYGSCF